MKKLLILAVCVAGFFFIAAPIYMKYGDRSSLTVNGKPFADAYFVNGVWAMKLEDFARLAGANTTLEPVFQLNQQTGELIGLLLPAVQTAKKADGYKKVEPSSSQNTIGGLTVDKTTHAELVPAVEKANVATVKLMPGSTFHVQKQGHIGTTFLSGGVRYLKLDEAARAFGGTLTIPQGAKPGQALSLNFTVNGDGILAMNP